MPFVALDENVRLYYEDIGEGRPIVFVHGFAMSHSIWEMQQISHRFAKEYRVITLDLRGHGISSKPNDGYDIKTFSDDMNGFFGKLRLRNVVYVGWSLGVAVGLQLAANNSDAVTEMVLIGGTPCWGRLPDFEFGHSLDLIETWLNELRSNRKKWTEEFILGMFKDRPDQQIISKLSSMTMMLPESAAAEIIMDSSTADLRGLLKNVKQRTAIFHGVYDRMDYIQAGRYMARSISNSEFVEFKNSGHVPFLEETEEFVAQMHGFLRGG